jgi:hypothetical protein
VQKLLKVTVLPWFVTHPRTLAAWVAANREAAAKAWRASSGQFNIPDSKVSLGYVELPIRIRDGISDRRLQVPNPQDLEPLFSNKRAVVQIIGPGGIGKTTLSRHIGELALAGGEPGGFSRCMLPIWVDEDTTDLWGVIRSKINAWFIDGEAVEEEILKALLQKKFLLPIFDRLSERSAETQSHVRTVNGSHPFNSLLITARNPVDIDVAELLLTFPEPLDSATLLYFMTAIIREHAANRNSKMRAPFGTVEEQLELGKKLAGLIQIRVGATNREVPILPLLVMLFVSEAIRVFEENRPVDDLPKTMPDTYMQYLRRLNPKVIGLTNAMCDEDMLRVSKVLARLALGEDCIPKEFTRELAQECIKAEIPDLPQGLDPLRRLVANGVLLSKNVGGTTFFRFELDPIAEFLGAEAYLEIHTDDSGFSKELPERSKNAAGFHNALLITIESRRTRGE